jgi:hypothetical protein
MRLLARSFLVALLPCAVGCTGFSLGENDPDTQLGTALGEAQIAVDPRTDTVFQIVEEGVRSSLVAVRPSELEAVRVADLSGHTDPRMLPVSSGVMIMSESSGFDEVRVFDPETLEQTAFKELGAQYHGTRISSSRRWIAVSDGSDSIHILDAETLETIEVPHGGDWIEAMYLHNSDRLAAISFDGLADTAHILVWDMAQLEAGAFEMAPEGKTWDGAAIDVSVEGVTWDMALSFTWVGVSPQDELVVFPVRAAGTNDGAHELLVLDTTSGEVRVVPDAKGPVGFSPDGSTIVAYGREGAEGDQSLVLIDARSLEVDVEEVAIDGGITYFVSHDGDVVVVGSNLGGQSLVLYDLDSGRQTKMDGPGIGLNELVSREGTNELYIVDTGGLLDENDGLFRLDMGDGTLTQMPTRFRPERIAYLPSHDFLVLGDVGRRHLHYYHPSVGVSLAVRLPDP